jgi:hypothetical protein
MRFVNSDLFYGERGRMGRVQKGTRGGFGGKKLVSIGARNVTRQTVVQSNGRIMRQSDRLVSCFRTLIGRRAGLRLQGYSLIRWKPSGKG